MKRILVIGTSGSGKTTFARMIARRLAIPFFPSDPFYWGKDWKLVSHEDVRRQIEAVVLLDAWVLDGNFDNERELVWDNADCIIWLDYPLATILLRVITRNLGWWISRQTVWSGNRMTLSRAISGVRHSIRSYRIKKRHYPQWLGQFADEKVVRFQNDWQAESWLIKKQADQS